MTRYRFHQFNVFGERRGSGSAVVVCETPDFPDPRTMQALAHQFHVPRTVFLDPKRRRLRIYTPQYEQPYSAQAVLAAAATCAGLSGEAGTQAFYAPHGEARAWNADDQWWLDAHAGAVRPAAAPRGELAASLGLAESDLASEPCFVDAGLDILLLEARSRQAVLQATPDARALANQAQVAGQVPVAAIWCRDGELATLRVFSSDQFNLYEEFGSGSAAAAIGAWLLSRGNRPPVTLKLEQGHTIHRLVTRLSVVHLRIDDARRVQVGGKVWRIGGGEIEW
ncbi:PhzF family phenazine biosynthesis protein [Chitinolyticbacter meiyuanensis]|uniref:PhzF family phenazine biosynthesis protein n=1 Tax=Chitinolyticbacter meiyuanensis TaxID=682798 RepID=UPI0016523AF9|nr:PhzF family phenazine biosynthesis protein [Chitinolyticbacter meiyuanensis]